MKEFNNTKIIGIDHGYGNMKTANFCFPTGIMSYDNEPLFTAFLLSARLQPKGKNIRRTQHR